MAYERSKFDFTAPCCVGAGPDAPTMGQVARLKYDWLQTRQTELAYRIRRRNVTGPLGHAQISEVSEGKPQRAVAAA